MPRKSPPLRGWVVDTGSNQQPARHMAANPSVVIPRRREARQREDGAKADFGKPSHGVFMRSHVHFGAEMAAVGCLTTLDNPKPPDKIVATPTKRAIATSLR